VLDIAHLLGPERARLLQLLRGLPEEAWTLPTPCPGWDVHSLAAHLLGDDLGRLGRSRDGWVDTGPPDGEGMVPFIDRLNADWVTAARRLSPVLLVELLTWSGAQISAYWSTVDLSALGEPVTWAGPDPAPVWLDAARDLSEYWVHRRQLSAAVGRAPEVDHHVDRVVLQTLLHALPHRLAQAAPDASGAVAITLTGTGAASWHARREQGRWTLQPGDSSEQVAWVELDGDLAWRRWTRGASAAEVRHGTRWGGDPALVDVVLDLVSAIV
jgi:uncharacterized protein (TIGR03083 family)